MPTFTTADQTTLHYETYGTPGDGRPTVVFLNGMTQSTQHWKSQARAFEEEGFAVVTYDARGQGDSGLGEQPLSLELHAADLAALLEELGLAQADLVGFSHGARVALAFANHHPERLRRLVLCSATASPTALARTIVRSWREILAAGGLEAMSWAAVPDILGGDFLRDNERFLGGIIKASVQRNSPEGVRALLEAMMAYPDLSELATGVEAPTLVISASEDLLVEAEGAAELARLTGGEHVEVEGVGHTVPIEAPERFREIALEFLRRTA